MKHDDGGFDTLGEEDEDVFDDENEDDDDGDALSSSPSIPDDVLSIPLTCLCLYSDAICYRTSILTSCTLCTHSLPQSKVRRMQ